MSGGSSPESSDGGTWSTAPKRGKKVRESTKSASEMSDDESHMMERGSSRSGKIRTQSEDGKRQEGK
jgi:hypothetical protein